MNEVLFKSKEYGVGGHNKLELRTMDDGSVRLWIHDGDCHALICMDKSDNIGLTKQLRKYGKLAPEEIQLVDFMKPIKRDKLKTTSEVQGTYAKKKRKPRSDKGEKRAKAKK